MGTAGTAAWCGSAQPAHAGQAAGAAPSPGAARTCARSHIALHKEILMASPACGHPAAPPQLALPPQVANVSPASVNLGETLSTLRFADQAKHIRSQVGAGIGCSAQPRWSAA